MGEDLKSQAAEVVRKALTVGVGAVFLTEESLRAIIKDLKLPKELIGGLLESANRTKSEFFEKLSQDILSRVKGPFDPREIVQDVLQKNEIHMDMKISFQPKDLASRREKPQKRK